MSDHTISESASPAGVQHSTATPGTPPAGSATLPGSVATEPRPADVPQRARQSPPHGDTWSQPTAAIPATGPAPAWGGPAGGSPYSTTQSASAPGWTPPGTGCTWPPGTGGTWPPGTGGGQHVPASSGRGKLIAGLAVGAIALATLAGGTGAAAERWLTGDQSTGTTVITRETTPVAQSKFPAGTAEAAAATISRSTVTIAVTGTDERTGQSGQGTGSGVVLGEDGYVITNHHVVALATSGGSVSVQLPDGSSRPASIVGTDPTNDLAVIKLKDTSGLKAATFGDSGSLKLGQPVLAMGAPLGLSGTVTQGIVSAVNRPVRTGNGQGVDAVIDAVQTDAAINPGNSGGPLVDMSGRVVGINSAIATVSGGSASGQSGNIGVGFAIPANDAVKIAKQLIDKGTAQHATLGVSAQTAQDGAGAVIQEVQSGSPAAAAGLRTGDEIVKVGDRAVVDVDSLIAAVRDHDPGSKVEITYKRAGQQSAVTATLVGRGGN